MANTFELKEQVVAETPLLLFDCELASGAVERWSTHRVECDGETYEARVLRHNLFEMQTASDQGVDGIPRVSLTLANADSHFSQLERTVGWKGAKLTARFVFFDLKSGRPASESSGGVPGYGEPARGDHGGDVPADGGEPDEHAARAAAAGDGSSGGARGSFRRRRSSARRRCTAGRGGGTRDSSGAGTRRGCVDGTGNLDGGAPFTWCGYTRAHCEARGMFARGRGGARDAAVRGNRVRAVFDPGAELRGEELARFGGSGERGAVQRLRAAGVRDGVVCAAGGVRAQRRQPDAHGSAARDGRDCRAC